MIAALTVVFTPRWPRLLAAVLLASVVGASLYGIRVFHVGREYEWYANEGLVMPELDGFRDPVFSFMANSARALDGQNFGDALATSVYFVDLFAIGVLFLSVFNGQFPTLTRVFLLTACILVMSLTTLIPPPPYATSTYATATSATTLLDPMSAVRALAVADVYQRTRDPIRRAIPFLLVGVADYLVLLLGAQYTFAVVGGTIIGLLVHFSVRSHAEFAAPKVKFVPPLVVETKHTTELVEPSTKDDELAEPSMAGVYGVADALDETQSDQELEVKEVERGHQVVSFENEAT